MTFLGWFNVPAADTARDGAADDSMARNTARHSPVGAPAATIDTPPEVNDKETDPNPELGMSTRTLTGYWHDKAHGVGYLDVYGAATTGSQALDAGQSDKGTAAQREREGEAGPGTQQWAESIEPAIHDASFFGSDYFAANQPGVYVTQPGDGIEPRHDASRQDIMEAYAAGVRNPLNADQWSSFGAYLRGES